MNGGKRITLVPSGGIPVTFVDYGGQRVTEVESGGRRVTEVDYGGKRVTRVGEPIVPYVPASATALADPINSDSATITYSLTLNDDESALLGLYQGDTVIAEATFTEDVNDAIYEATALTPETSYDVKLNGVVIYTFVTEIEVELIPFTGLISGHEIGISGEVTITYDVVMNDTEIIEWVIEDSTGAEKASGIVTETATGGTINVGVENFASGISYNLIITGSTPIIAGAQSGIVYTFVYTNS